ncbi:argonaute-like protein [Gloeophyllum trabeum ATCC 11539]|uniref:Argonaute-like protein n=1 Tax=Gloeophyllum trabeum (strain ATCC 11539 / FP-39264 / Madison 617) TaxID=670483 RepID=S7QI59_GLOTA|nr:argonaute-like protein [Gloeophyllum trabeum ATCC 11539]EPQ59451.1 argonaute-like protein [Gloeophyllum trabeum ATCC 11539]
MGPRPAGAGGRGRGGPSRGGPPTRGGAAAGASGGGSAVYTTSPHVTTVGVKRTAFGTSGRRMEVYTNHFAVKIPEAVIHHYDVISPSEKTLPARLNMELITTLQLKVAANIFTPRAVYDGRKNLFAARELPFGPNTPSREFEVEFNKKTYKIRLTKVAEINPEVLARFLEGKQSHDNAVLTAITALNVVIRMEPTLNYPFNVRSFFTDKETKDIGSGIVLWRGYFQSIRPAIGRMLINVDISTGTMYKSGSLLKLCLEFVGRSDQPLALAPRRGFPDRERLRLQRFISGIRILTKTPGEGQQSRTPRVLKKLSTAGASDLTFTMREGGTMTVAEYFQKTYNMRLQFPEVLCAEVGSGALIPLELCVVPPGQIMRKQVPPEKTKDVLDFATKRPEDRLQSIRNGLSVLQYGQSEYVRQFGMVVDEAAGALTINARVLDTPTLRYGKGSRQPTIVRVSEFFLIDKKFYSPASIDKWVVVVYERQQRFNANNVREMVEGFVAACRDVGMVVKDPNPIVRWENGQGNIGAQLREAGKECMTKTGSPPSLIVAVLPEGGTDIYTAIKHFGDITMGVATQCLKSSRCFRAKPQYYANVSLKLNVKLGGINTIPDPPSAPFLTDPNNPTIVMGADVIHPAPGSEGRPSFTSLVANVDSDTAKYIAASRVQTSRQEIIEDLGDMAHHMLDMYMKYRRGVEKKANPVPKRIIFYRDGVSEGQFKQVLDLVDSRRVLEACQKLNIKPTITVVVVGKRHHVRFFPKNPSDGDRKSGNCPAGTVIDRDVAHPTEFDFYLQSHGGLLGTSRPAHYNVLYDENNLTPDGLQSLSFALCHVYARSTRSVSIPAPVYYADIVCTRAKNHYDPNERLDFSDSATNLEEGAADQSLDKFKRGFKPLHQKMTTLMYFS